MNRNVLNSKKFNGYNTNKQISTSSSFFNKFKFDNTDKSKYIIILICSLIVLGIIAYMLICYYNYTNTKCYTKKEFMDYLIDFSNPDVCILENEPKQVKSVNLNIPLLPLEKKEVFHISNQDYTYDQAKCKCESYGARLASKEELTDAYNNGANWCSYGWSEKQSAYYPVQKCEWDKIDTENKRLPDNKKRYCGMPGLNGGFFANPEIKFGANCYGVKPKGKIVKQKQPFCPPMNFCKLESNFQASHKLDTDDIVGFNNEQWNMNM